jgi:hypothetical protein
MLWLRQPHGVVEGTRILWNGGCGRWEIKWVSTGATVDRNTGRTGRVRGYVGRSRGRGAGAEQVEERRQMKAEGRDRGREAEDKRTFFTSASFLTPS